MNINNIGLAAFYQCALKQNMTQASVILGVTQSALSQRISALEDDLETSLFIREGKNLKLTPAGIELLNYCHSQMSLENELLSKIKGNSDEIAGVIRIGAFSSVMRSLIIPQCSDFLRKHPKVSAEFKSYEMSELYESLKSGKADIIITDYHLAKKGIIETVIGQEEYVVIESSKYKTPTDLYLDHTPDDQATSDFFAHQTTAPKNYRRSFFGDIYGIIDGVEQGIGRAVMSKHLIEDNKKIKIVTGFKKYQRPIVLSYFERPYYPNLFKSILAKLTKKEI